MNHELDSVRSVMRRIRDGGEVSVEEVKSLHWEASPELDKLLQKIYRNLMIFASDDDIRAKDAEYDASWRSSIADLLDELDRRSEPY